MWRKQNKGWGCVCIRVETCRVCGGWKLSPTCSRECARCPKQSKPLNPHLVLRESSPRTIILIPETATLANRKAVTPPKMQLGIDVKKAPICSSQTKPTISCIPSILRAEALQPLEHVRRRKLGLRDVLMYLRQQVCLVQKQ
jgi:hypothetical protein